MDTRELLKIDLNLLKSLQVMLEERNVSNAAKRLFITQPAMSKTLARLRSVFDDPLFTRSSHGMQPTPRAMELAQGLESVLIDIQGLVGRSEFDPAQWRGELTIALSEYIGVGMLPTLMGRLQTTAPGLTLNTVTRVEQQLEQLALGGLDFAIHIQHAHYPEHYQCHDIGGNPPIILARTGHPLSGRTPSWEDVARYPLVRMYISDLEQMDIFHSQSAFARLRAHPGANFETSHLLTALEVLRTTDYLMPGPPFVLRNPVIGDNIQALPFPGTDNPALGYRLVRHRRTEKSAVHN